LKDAFEQLRIAKEENIPMTSLNHDKILEEIGSMAKWKAGTIHEIPYLSEFMNPFGGVVQKSFIYWRQEDCQVFSMILEDIQKSKKLILRGSPGIGKSMMLVLVMFYAAVIHQKPILLFRRLGLADQQNCLLFIEYKNGNLGYFAIQKCKQQKATEIESCLSESRDALWFMLDGFVYENIPDDLMAFKMLSTSQQVDLKSQFSTHATKILLPCWTSEDLFALGTKLGFKDLQKRYYFSGGSARKFCRDTLQEIKINIDEAVAVAGTNIDWLFSRTPVKDGKQIDRIRRTFVMDVNNKDH
jgi:hypothetical protein